MGYPDNFTRDDYRAITFGPGLCGDCEEMTDADGLCGCDRCTDCGDELRAYDKRCGRCAVEDVEVALLEGAVIEVFGDGRARVML